MTAPAEEESFWRSPRLRIALFYRLIRPESPRTFVVVLHGFGEHGGRHLPMARWLAQQGVAVAIPDLPGHGRSGGARGDFGSLRTCVEELAAAARARWMPQAGHQPCHLFGHSFGGVLAIEWLLYQPEDLRRAVIQCPLLEVAFPIPGWKRWAGEVLGRWWPTARLPIDIDARNLSHDPVVTETYRKDPLVHNAMSGRTYRDLLRASAEALERAGDIRTPVLLLCAGEDRVVSTPVARQWFAAVHSEKQERVFPGAFHELHHEAVRQEAWQRVLQWITT